jgi:1,2-diacylglycerol-3-alpha-glucose alpha-1,2-glucosyltransferase
MPNYKFIWFGYLDLKLVPKEISDAVNTKLDNLIFAGYVEPEELKCAYSGADLYLFPTLEETEGIPILEALTEQIPTLVRRIPVFSEYKENEVVYKADNITEFKQKIEDILNNKLPNLKEKGYEKAMEKDTKKVGKQLIDLYKKLIEGNI